MATNQCQLNDSQNTQEFLKQNVSQKRTSKDKKENNYLNITPTACYIKEILLNKTIINNFKFQNTKYMRYNQSIKHSQYLIIKIDHSTSGNYGKMYATNATENSTNRNPLISAKSSKTMPGISNRRLKRNCPRDHLN